MSIAKKIPLAAFAVGGLMMAAAGMAHADNSATIVSTGNSGLLSGISHAEVLSDPLENCGNDTVGTTSLLSGTSGNACAID